MAGNGGKVNIAPLGYYDSENFCNTCDAENDDSVDEEMVFRQHRLNNRAQHEREGVFASWDADKSLDITDKDSSYESQDSFHDEENTATARKRLSCLLCPPCDSRTNIAIWALLLTFIAGFVIGLITSSSSETISAAALNGSQSQASEAPNYHTTSAPMYPEQTGSNYKRPTQAPTIFFNFDSEATVSYDDDDDDDDDDDAWVDLSGDYLVGVYYYPWHGNDFHRRDGYIRKSLRPPQAPALGEYDDSKRQTISQHLKWSRQANIGLWVTSWWGPNLREDITTRDVIMRHNNLGDMKIALHYETSGRIEYNETSGIIDLSNVPGDIDYICDRYFLHPNYYRIDGRPVLVVYLTRQLQDRGSLQQTLQIMRNRANQRCGQNIYIVGDHVFGDAPSNPSLANNAFSLLDAVTNYDVYGSMGRPMKYAGEKTVNKYHKEQKEWRRLALAQNCRFIPAATPGYNDRGVRLEADHPPLSRRLSADAEEGSFFWYQLEKAKRLVDPMVDSLILVNSFNEWHEDTQLEPVVGTAATLPVHFTGGMQYEGYGELYLDILRNSTVSQTNDNIFA